MTILAVIVGGLIGTALRLVIDVGIPHGDSDFPVSTLIINVIGAGALGTLVARVWPIAPPWLRAALGAGLLGSFTTFSALAVSLVALVHTTNWMPAAAYLAATLVLGLGAAWLGLRVGRWHHTGFPELDEVSE
jgi:CrcB protein